MAIKIFLCCAILNLIIKPSNQYYALSSYELDEGVEPDPDHPRTHITHRYFINKTTAICEEFKYLGMGGNMNNFAKMSDCERHLTFTSYEQASSCLYTAEKGACDMNDTHYKTRYTFVQSDDPKIVGECKEFRYSGCGGNANNFNKIEECEMACKVSRNLDAGPATNGDPYIVDGKNVYNIPNKFDCNITYDVDNPTPRIGIVPDYEQKECHYQALGYPFPNKREFMHLSQCVSLCFGPDNFIDACKIGTIHQLNHTTDPEILKVAHNSAKYYYYNTTERACFSFYSLIPESGFEAEKFDHTVNKFKSLDLCLSYCPAVSHYTQTDTVSVCELPLAGDVTNGSNNNGNLLLSRYYYNFNKDDPSSSICTEFIFGGLNMNLNNFATEEDCKSVCQS